MPKLLSFSNTAWYLHNYRAPVDRILRRRGWEVVMASPDGDFREDVQKAGFRWHEIPMSRSGVHPLREWRSARRLADVIEEENPDILHTFTMKGNINGSLAARMVGFPNLVNSIAGLGYVYSSSAAKARILRPLANLAYRLALAKGETIFQNSGDRRVFAESGLVQKSQSHLIKSSGVDVEEVQPAEPIAGPVRILFASRLLWTKGIGELIEAARSLQIPDHAFEIVVAGEPDPGNPATIRPEVVEKWAKEGIIRHVGFTRDMPGLMKTCHIACFPSKHKEGVPRFLVEAAAAGLPIVTTNNRGCIEIGREGENALIVPIGDVPGLASALRRLIVDSDLRASLGARGRQIAIDEFSVESVAQQTLDVYERLLCR